MSRKLPLQGLRVLDLASFIAGPVASTVMGDYGAEVIKIEPPGEGDPQRKLGQAHSIPQHPVNFCWHMTNRNKRSVVLDLKNPLGREAFDRLTRAVAGFVVSIHRSTTPASRMFASKNKDNNTLSGASGVNSMNSNSDEVDTANTDAMFCSLVDSIFLIGPSAQSVYEQIAAHSVTVSEPLRSVISNNNIPTNPTTTNNNTNNNTIPTTTTTTVPDFNAVLPSTMLFVTENHCPPEMAMLLPAYCFPR